MSVIRPAAPADVDELLALRIANRAYLERWEPDGGNRYEREGVAEAVARDHQFVIVDDGAIAGFIQLMGVSPEPFASAMIGYWVSESRAGRGLASRAVAEVVEHAFGTLDLHRVEAGTAVENVASQRVLERNRFTNVGVLREHILIGGRWVDHYLWERIVGD